ncbi:hypothetical protein HRR83_003282 [Exophiala dermatitidis]|uniref:Large ribosomal subunit protein bL34m n=1 Tax=Exophiala dermatitidis TaxID=5970 RepID=A0AAN6EVN6_EXODE|nr:hypothetical protein HRR74_004560 [Exophiala dermatitidis]KAJ4521163.1 hypothetical protein HRR73_003504 [Exophiala dermatitidis]KAJ4547752.1 hypothetical protein HRR76_000378 [Exophiala dermatitidis]KAJ4553689.1 hypothetical protein HRR77_002066 [Exophiala dermatitidis]KAJ4578016.1 hypothetical protein HRR79_001336 [Exophiala dermatitidis]
MCRLCGRVIKCIFDTMPSRIHHVPSRRAFTTIRRLAAPSAAASSRSPSSVVSLARAFHGLSLQTNTTATTSPLTPTSSLLSTMSARPSLSCASPQSSLPALSRSFSTTSALFGYRRRMDTYSPSRRVQKRRHGYLARLKTKGGREVLKRRRLKGRKYLSW